MTEYPLVSKDRSRIPLMRAQAKGQGERQPRRVLLARSAQGFTLLELVVALSVFALGLTGVTTLNNSALLATANAAQMQEASYLAERHLAALQMAQDLVSGDFAGTYQGLSQPARYPWRLRVSTLDSTPLQPRLRSFSKAVKPLELHLIVTVEQGSRPLEFYALVLAPVAQPVSMYLRPEAEPSTGTHLLTHQARARQ